jgi:hypothetical protein
MVPFTLLRLLVRVLFLLLFFPILPRFNCSCINSFQVLREIDFSFLSILSFLIVPSHIEITNVPKNGMYFVIQVLPPKTHIQKLQSVLDSDSILFGGLVAEHQKLDHMEERFRLKTVTIDSSAFLVHVVELLLVDTSIEILIYFLF